MNSKPTTTLGMNYSGNYLLLLILCWAVIPTTQVAAQVNKARAHSFAFRLYNEIQDNWEEWGEWQEVNILIVFDFTKQKINIYSKTTQEYDFISDILEEESADGTPYYRIECVDADGKRCFIRIVYLKDSDKLFHLYVHYEDINFVYEFKYESD